MESEAQPTPPVTTGDLDQDVAAARISPVDPAPLALEASEASGMNEPAPPPGISTAPATPTALQVENVLSGQSATSTLHSAADPARPPRRATARTPAIA